MVAKGPGPCGLTMGLAKHTREPNTALSRRFRSRDQVPPSLWRPCGLCIWALDCGMNDEARPVPPVPPRLLIQSTTCTDCGGPLDRSQVFGVCPNCAAKRSEARKSP